MQLLLGMAFYEIKLKYLKIGRFLISMENVTDLKFEIKIYKI